jgi:hypothetical protein
MPIHSLTKETYAQLLTEVAETKAELSTIRSTEPIDMYRTDLGELKKNLKTTK